MTRRRHDLPDFYTQWRQGGEWSAPCAFINRPTRQEAYDRARHHTGYEVDGLVKGKVAQWKLICHGVTVLAWEEDGRSV